MNAPGEYSFGRYLAAKKAIDDRALHAGVWEALKRNWPHNPGTGAPRLLEVGMGIGTMLERLLERGVFAQGTYLGIDAEAANIQPAHRRLAAWAHRQATIMEPAQAQFTLRKGGLQVQVEFREGDIRQYARRKDVQGAWDVIIAHAVLDLLHLPEAVPALLGLLRPGGLFYFSMNFDGETIFEPMIDPSLDDLIVRRYHQSMDERLVDGQPSGDSQAGRHLFNILQRSGGHILEAGASDWVVYPQQGGYPADEAYFLYHILHFFETTLGGRMGAQEQNFSQWLNQRRRQVQCGELVFIAHQLDFLGRVGEYGTQTA